MVTCQSARIQCMFYDNTETCCARISCISAPIASSWRHDAIPTLHCWDDSKSPASSSAVVPRGASPPDDPILRPGRHAPRKPRHAAVKLDLLRPAGLEFRLPTSGALLSTRILFQIPQARYLFRSLVITARCYWPVNCLLPHRNSRELANFSLRGGGSKGNHVAQGAHSNV